MKRVLWAALLVLIPSFAAAARMDALWAQYRAQDFFALKKHLPPPRRGDGTELLFLRAAALAAFGETDRSAAILRDLVARKPLDPKLELKARELLMLDLRARFQYAQALAAVQPLLARSSDLANRAGLLEAVRDVQAQTVRRGSGNWMDADGDGRVRILLGRGAVHMAFDTGANFSVVSRSAARRLGLRIRSADYAIASPLGGSVRAGVAVADFAFADGTRLSNVLFLVLPDRSLVLGDGRVMDGLLGVPVMVALGPVTFAPGRVRLAQAKGAIVPLAQGANDPLLEVSHRGKDLLCRLDTGAERTLFFAPFTGEGRLRSMQIGGAAGTRKFDASGAGTLAISIAGREMSLPRAAVLTIPNAPACALGRDALARFAFHAIDLKALTLTLTSR